MNLAGTFFLYSTHTVVITALQSSAIKISQCLRSYLAVHSVKAYFIPFIPYGMKFTLFFYHYYVGQIQRRGAVFPG